MTIRYHEIDVKVIPEYDVEGFALCDKIFVENGGYNIWMAPYSFSLYATLM